VRSQGSALQEQLQSALQKQADTRAENTRLKGEMEELKGRIEQLEVVEGALCPLCGQPLSPDDRQRLVEELQANGKDMGDRYRTNQTELRESEQLVRDFQAQISTLVGAETDLIAHTQRLAQLTARQEQIDQLRANWEQDGSLRLVEISQQLAEGSFATEAQAHLAQIDAELMAIGYDAAAHDAARRAELAGRSAEAAQRDLEKARATLAPLEREIASLETQVTGLKADALSQEEEYGRAASSLAAAEAEAPDQDAAERELMSLREQENRLGQEVGAAKQRVEVLGDLKKRRKSWEAHREELARLVSQLKQLERAFGKDGVPALLIEQALPQIEAKANDILDRLSGGNMSVRFITQAAYKDRRRDDLRETLDIQISDSAGTRDYEMFSGGEAFRVNFAIRLALSEVLAQRAGARLQTLVIDEGFGSQDALGRQRLIEAINLVRQDFAKILVITHIEELKDAFPNRIEVEKTGEGSRIRVV
jgi:DNA repair protein SbcC/Rad50